MVMMNSKNSIGKNLRSDDSSFERKEGHILLSASSQTSAHILDQRFNYEPLFATPKINLERKVLSKTVRAPLWISSMTGGTDKAKLLNSNLASIAHEFGLGMGLGSIRPLLFNDERINDFDIRKIIGPDLPLFGNIGIAQVEELIKLNKLFLLDELCKKLELDALFIHINLLQEWFQPEGDVLQSSPLEILKLALDGLKIPLLVKEVGHGFGPQSLAALFELPLAGIEFGAFGGTNFSLIEEKRKSQQDSQTRSELEHPLIYVGHSADEMIETINKMLKTKSTNHLNKLVIASGGMRNFLDGYYALSKLPGDKTLYAQAKEFIIRAHDRDLLAQFVEHEMKGLIIAYQVLQLKTNPGDELC
jgi:isopentenyl-diphosphate delta-isomerase